MIDTHCHLHPGEEIKIEGLEYAILSASCVEDSKSNLELAKVNKKLLPAVGIHPQEKITNYKLLITNLEELLKNNKNIIAIGECGLDFSEEHDEKQQIEMFIGQIELAIKFDKPLIVHSRKAMDKTIEILNNYKNTRGVVHCYTGGIKRISKINNNFYFGFDGNLTYEDGMVEVVKNIPKNRLVLETDAPELTPVPFRGEKNYPENVRFIYQKVADIWGIIFEEAEKIIDANAKRLFGL